MLASEFCLNLICDLLDHESLDQDFDQNLKMIGLEIKSDQTQISQKAISVMVKYIVKMDLSDGHLSELVSLLILQMD